MDIKEAIYVKHQQALIDELVEALKGLKECLPDNAIATKMVIDGVIAKAEKPPLTGDITHND